MAPKDYSRIPFVEYRESLRMPKYIAKFIDYRDEVFGYESFEAEHDDAAKVYANRILSTAIGKGHEVWQGDRLVHRELYRS